MQRKAVHKRVDGAGGLQDVEIHREGLDCCHGQGWLAHRQAARKADGCSGCMGSGCLVEAGSPPIMLPRTTLGLVGLSV